MLVLLGLRRVGPQALFVAIVGAIVVMPTDCFTDTDQIGTIDRGMRHP
jgi:hypothetical protein